MKLSYAEVADLEAFLGYLDDCHSFGNVPKLNDNDYLLAGLMRGKMLNWLQENG